MEVLVVALAALATLLVPLMIAMAEIAILGASALASVIALAIDAARSGSWNAARQARQEKRAASPRLTRWTRWVTVASAVTLSVTLVAMLALNTLCFDWFVRRSLAAGERQNGIVADFEHADGNLFAGRVHLQGATFVRQGHPASDFDLSVNELSVDADVWKLLTGQIVFEDVSIDGVGGTFTRTGEHDPLLPRRQFTIERLTVDNVSLHVTDGSHPPREVSVPLAIDSLQIADFRSTWAAFDVLFRSTCAGLLDGQPFEITNREVGNSRETVWAARDLPVHLLSGYFTGPLASLPLTWLHDGRLDVDVTTRWRSEESYPELEMHCRLVAHGFAADVPAELANLQKAVVDPTIAALNRSGPNLPIEFDLVMQKNAFKGQLSPLSAGMADAFAQASSKTFAQLFPNAAEKIGQRVNRLRTRLRGLVRPRQAAEGDEAIESAEIQ